MFVFLSSGFQRQGYPCHFFFLSNIKTYYVASIGPHYDVETRNSLDMFDALILRQNSIYFDLFTLNLISVNFLQFLELH